MPLNYTLFSDSGLSTITISDWYNFVSVDSDEFNSFDNYYGIYNGQAGSYNNEWEAIDNSRFALIVSSDYEALDGYGEKLVVSSAEEEVLAINSYVEQNLELKNAELEADGTGGGVKISLSLPDKHVHFVFDESGSQLWNDGEKLRYDLASRFVNRVSSTYPGTVLYSATKYGGKAVNMLLSASVAEVTPLDSTYNLQKIYEQNQFADDINNFYGIRVVRKIGSYSSSPVDGEIVFDGIASKFCDSNLTAGTEYYYSLYTYNRDYSFSTNPKRVKFTANTEIAPYGVKIVDTKTLVGSGLRRDSNTVSIWHFDEAEEDVAYDFMKKSDLELTNHSWLNEKEVLLGVSGLRFNGINTQVVADNISSDFMYKRNSSVMFWIKPFDFSEEWPIVSVANDTDEDWSVSLESSTGYVKYSVNNSSYTFSSTTGLQANEWNCVAITTANDGSVSVYINGTLCGTGTGTPTDSVNDSSLFELRFGYNNSNNFLGFIAEASLHNIARDESYISDYSNENNEERTDNGDRLAVLKITVPQNADYIGGVIRIVKKVDGEPSNEDDGEIIYEDTAVVGDVIVTDYENVIAGHNVFYKIFTQNILGNFSHIDNSLAINLAVTEIDNAESKRELLSLDYDVPSPTEVLIYEGVNKNCIKWKLNDANDDAKRILIYVSTEQYPLVDGYDVGGELVFEGAASDGYFVHRGILNNVSYYYSIFSIDSYGRPSTATNVSGEPNLQADETAIPLLEVSSVSYELISENSANIFWDKLPELRVVDGYFDQNVVLFAKLIDEFGNIITSDVKTELQIEASSIIVDDEAEDIFRGETEFDPSDASSLYNAVMSSFSNGYSTGVLTLRTRGRDNTYLLKNLKQVSFSVRVKAYIPDVNSEKDSSGNYSENVFEYLSNPILVRLNNPLDIEITNKNNKHVTKACKQSLTALDGSSVILRKVYNGTYVGASENYIARILLSYKNDSSINIGSVSVATYEVNKDLCSDGTVEIVGLRTDLGVSSGIITPTVGRIEILDNAGNPTGVFSDAVYVDVEITPPSQSLNIMLYVKALYGNNVVIKKHLIVFDSTLRVELSSQVPIPDGSSVCEQFANVYIIDPDDPDNVAKRTYPPNNTIVKWELTKVAGSVTRPIYSTDNVTMPNGVYSYIRNGVARNVFLGPIDNVDVVGRNLDGSPIYESHSLKASVLYNGLSGSDTQEIEIIPLTESGSELAGSHFLMEFDHLKEHLYANGRSYIKMTISHDASTSTTKYSDCFRSCMSSLGKTIYELQSGQLVFLSSSEPDLEIIWGDVVETVDPYTGENILDISSANSANGSAYITLGSGDSTTVYFRLEKAYDNQKSIGYVDYDPLCSCIRLSQYVNYNNEITIVGSVTSVFNGRGVAITAGGDMSVGIPATIIIPQNPLEIKVVDKRVNGVSVDDLVIDGISENEIIFEVSYGGYPVPDGTTIEITINNNFEALLKASASVVYTESGIDSLIDDTTERSYASLKLLPISSGKTFDSNLYAKVTYDPQGSSMSKTVCLKFSYDAENSVSEVVNLFTNRGEVYDATSTTSPSWNSIANLNTGRANFVLQPANGKLYAIGGVNSKNILASVEEYDPNTNSWTTKTPMAYSRMNAISVVVGSIIYVIGGLSYDSLTRKLYVSRKVESYNTLTDSWTELEEMPQITNSTVDPIDYGNAFGVGVYDSGVIYVLSGIRDISDDGLTVVYNDKILAYTVGSDTWSSSDAAEDVDYERISPCVLVKSGYAYVFGGAYENSEQKEEYCLTAYKFNLSTEVLSVANSSFGIIPNNRYKAAYVSVGSKLFVSGGTNFESNCSCNFGYLDFSSSVFNYTDSDVMEIGRNGASSATLNIGGDDLIYVVGGITSGKTSSFLKINTKISSEEMKLNGKQSIGVEISVEDSFGNIPNTDVNVLIKGYVQFLSASNSDISNIESSLLKYPVLFTENIVTTENGKAAFELSPRADDVLAGLISSNVYTDGIANSRYKIVLQASVLDDSYYGQTFVQIVDNFESSTLTNESCYFIGSNIILKQIGNIVTDGNFAILTDPVFQNPIESLTCISDRPWISYVENATEGSVTSTEILEIIDDLSNSNKIGSSPIYDALAKSSTYLSSVDLDDIKKTIIIFADDEENSSSITLKEAISEINAIDGKNEVPVVFANMAISDSFATATYVGGTENKNINELCSSTGGQGVTVNSEDVADDVVGIICGKTKGSLGYGSATYIIDLLKKSEISYVNVAFDLPSNTNGKWRFSISEDGYNFSEPTTKFKANATIEFEKIIGRYVKVEMELFSGLSASNEPEYEDVPVPQAPSVTSINIGYVPVKIDYLFLNEDQIDGELVEAFVVANTNCEEGDGTRVDVAVTTSQRGNWNYYYNNAHKSVNEYGKIVIPIRYGTVGINNIEPLIKLDKFTYQTTYGPWNPTSEIIVYNSENEEISTEDYQAYANEGKIVFSSTQTGDLKVEIRNSEKISVAIRIENTNKNKFVEVGGVGYLYNTKLN